MIHSQLEQLYKIAPIYRELFPKQLELLLNPNRFCAGITGSRSGKTTASAVFAVQELTSNPGSMGVYLARTDKSVKDIFMPIIRPLLAKYGIRAKINSDEILFENGSKLLVLGANHPHKVENFRGLKLRFAIVDECASFNQQILNYFIDEILVQRLSDLQGKLYLIGTPAAHCSGLFHEVTTGKVQGWGVTHWTAFDNPHMNEQCLKDIAWIMESKQWERNHPKLQREYDGIWATNDDEFLVRKPLLETPIDFTLSKWRTVIGVDFGFNDKTAFSIIGWERNNPKAYVLRTIAITGEQAAKTKIGMVTYIGNILNDLKRQYAPVRIVGDPAGASKIIMDEFLNKHKVYMESAVKQNKAHYIEIMNDALTNHMLVLHPEHTKELQQEMGKLVWNEEHTREREGIPCDHFDATLYAWREALSYTEKIPHTPVFNLEKAMVDEVMKQDRREMIGSKDIDEGLSDTMDFLDHNEGWSFDNE